MRDLTKVIAPKPPGPVGIATIWPKLCQNATEEDLRNWVFESWRQGENTV